jgi:hypothetical protein
MKDKLFFPWFTDEGQVIASFGKAQLIMVQKQDDRNCFEDRIRPQCESPGTFRTGA